MSNFNLPIKNLSVRFSREQRVFHQLTNKDALIDALISLYNNTAKCQLKNPQESASTFIQLYKPICHEINKTKVSLKDFKVLNKDTFVEGAFGKVTIVKSIHDKKNIYAMKTLNKSHLIKQAGRSSPMEERLVLSNENEEWLPKLYASFQDSENLYLVMEYAHGGDLENLMNIRNYKFNEDEAKFYCAELILAIERVHQLGYMHRDIKPANILIDSKGHIKLGDLGCCISIDTTDSLFPVGTALYMSPEMSDSTFGTTIYGPEADWWSVGIILYELLYGVTPFTGKVSDIQKSLMNPKVQFNNDITVSDDAKDLITKLLLKSKKDRLGVKGGAGEIKSHPFFKGIDWKTLRTEATPPFVPSIRSLDDITFFAATTSQEDEDEDDQEEDEEEDDETEDDTYREYPFIGYSYSCSLLNNDKSPTATNTEKRIIGDSQAFLAQFRQRITSTPDPKQAEEEKVKQQQQHEMKIAELKALLKEKSDMIDTMHEQMEEERCTLNCSHNDEILKLNTLLAERNDYIESQNRQITQLESKNQILEVNNRNLDSSDDIAKLNVLLEERNFTIESQHQKIVHLESKNKSLELHNKKLEINLDTLINGQKELETSLSILVNEKQELECRLEEMRSQLKEQNETANNALKQQLAEAQDTIESLEKKIEPLRNNESVLEKKALEDIPLWEAENKQLFKENNDLNDQLLELESQIDQLKEKLSFESKKSKELTDRYEAKLKDQSTDYDMLINQTKAEYLELKNELSKLQHQASTATRMKRASESLPNIPSTTTSPKILPAGEYSPGEGRSLILSSMWQRDRESLRNVQQALEESESKLAFAKRQVIRLKKEVKCFQKYTFEQHQKSEQSIKEDVVYRNGESNLTLVALQNGIDHSKKKSVHSKRISNSDGTSEEMKMKKSPLPKTPPQRAIDFAPAINNVTSFINDLSDTHSFRETDISAIKRHNADIIITERLSSAETPLGDADLALLKEIEKEQSFIYSTNRTIAARSRLSRTRGEIDQELERSLELSNKRIALLESKLKKPAAMVNPSRP